MEDALFNQMEGAFFIRTISFFFVLYLEVATLMITNFTLQACVAAIIFCLYSAAYFRDYALAQSTFGVAPEQARALGSQKKLKHFIKYKLSLALTLL
jgi:hypothetical protein